MSIIIEQLQEKIDVEYVGFRPNTGKVEPAHIANGLYRGLLGHISDTKLLIRFVISQEKKGIPKGHNLDEIYEDMLNEDKLVREIEKEDLSKLRLMLKRVVAADGRVFRGMESYSAGYKSFVSNDRIAQSGGEFVASWLNKTQSPLVATIVDSLQDKSDIISVMSLPLLENSSFPQFTPKIDFENTRFFKQPLSQEADELWQGLKEAACTLEKHLTNHPDKLFRLRLSVLFSCFVLTRHLSALEVCYVPNPLPLPPFLFDFSENSQDPVARASVKSCTRSHQAMTRFYAWAFGNYMEKLYTIQELQNEVTPIYKKSKKKEQVKGMWELAIERSHISNEPFNVLGQTIFQMMMLQSKDTPTDYFKKIGRSSGLFYPPNHASIRFLVKQDLLETLILGAVSPNETIDIMELQERFWQRYRIIIGGVSHDMERLHNVGIYQVDENALWTNRQRFIDSLARLDFARMLADGVLQVGTGVSHAV